MYFWDNSANNKIDASSTFHLKNANWPQLKSLILNKNYIGKSINNFLFEWNKKAATSAAKTCVYSSPVPWKNFPFVTQSFIKDGN